MPTVPTWLPIRAARPAAAAAAAALLGYGAYRSRSHLPSIGELGHPRATWVLLAVLAQAVSLAAYAIIVRELLAAGDVAARLSSLLRATLGGIAMNASLPGGQVASAAYWYRQLRQEGADRTLSVTAMAGSMVAGVISLGALFVAGVAVAGGDGPVAALRTPILAGVALVLGLAVVFRRRVPSLPIVNRPDTRGLLAVGALAFANWLFDCASLWAALAAVHASVPARSVLLAYTLAQLVAAVPLLPGGGGTVEATLMLAFAAFGHTSGSLLAGVLLYRVISCWGLIPVGWLAVALEHRPALLRRPAAVAVA